MTASTSCVLFAAMKFSIAEGRVMVLMIFLFSVRLDG